jgi:hypothetical protein
MEILQLDVIWLFDDIPGLQPWEQEHEEQKENNKKKKVNDCIPSWEEMRKRTSLKNPLLLSYHQREEKKAAENENENENENETQQGKE